MLSHISKAKRLLCGLWNEEWQMPFTCQFWLISWKKVEGYHCIWLHLHSPFILCLTNVINFWTVTITRLSAVIRAKWVFKIHS